MKFEESMQNLDVIVKEMESGKLSIDESLEHFSKGIKLCEECLNQLNEAKGKVTILQKQMNEIVEKNFNIQNE